MMRMFHTVFSYCCSPTQRAIKSQQVMLLNLSLAQSCKRNSYSLEFLAPLFLSTLDVAGCSILAGVMVLQEMGCILMTMTEDVLAYRDDFVARWKVYEEISHLGQ